MYLCIELCIDQEDLMRCIDINDLAIFNWKVYRSMDSRFLRYAHWLRTNMFQV